MTRSLRRLLSAAGVAEKLGYSQGWFSGHRAALEKCGFPPPALEKDEFGSDRWDELAIDRWLDGRMPSTLRELTGGLEPSRIDHAAITERLTRRAQEMAL